MFIIQSLNINLMDILIEFCGRSQLHIQNFLSNYRQNPFPLRIRLIDLDSCKLDESIFLDRRSLLRENEQNNLRTKGNMHHQRCL